MKRMLVGIAAVASLATTGAFAADLPPKAPVYAKAPVYVDPGYSGGYGYYGGGPAYYNGAPDYYHNYRYR